MRALLWSSLCIVVFCISCGRKDFPDYLNHRLGVEERVNDLVSRMSLAEKTSQMRYDAPAIDSLHIPAYNWWNECLHGVARAGKATVFPQAIGIAATWDQELVHRMAVAISDEARAKHHEFVRRGKRGIYQGLTFWSPNINIFRDPRWGRGMETYGEDPYLTGRLAVQFIKGLQGDHPKYLKVVATVKHFAVHSGPEPDRHTFDARVSQRDLKETYLPHFRAGIVEGGAYSLMCAYNRFMGEPCCGSSLLLQNILRNQWGFNGYVVSDCWAIHDFYAHHKVVSTPEEAAALAVQSGTDLNCGSVYRDLLKAVDVGLLTEDEIDVAVKRLLTARIKLGMFDPPEKVPYTKIPYSVVDCEEHQQLALETARKSIVLLKNQDNLLPLSKRTKRIAVIGPNADDVEVLLGNYNGNPTHPVTPLQGIRNKVSKRTDVYYALGCNWAENIPHMDVVPSEALVTSLDEKKNGLTAEYFNNREFSGEPEFIRVDEKIDFNWWDGAPKEGMDDDNFGVRWTGYLLPPVRGTYALGGNGFSAFKLFLDDSLLISFRNDHHPVTTLKYVDLEEKAYKIKIEYFDEQGDAHMRLLWSRPDRDHEKEAIRVAKKADVVVMCMGLSPRLEGEEMDIDVKGFRGGDRLSLNLSDIQNRLLKKVHKLGKPVVLVLLNGSAVAPLWAAENIPAIVEAWYPGQAAGTAIADVLFGDFNPAGRLPITFYKSVDQLPAFDDYNMDGKTYRYFKGYPLFPFGHGLSFTTFAYDNLNISEQSAVDGNITIRVDVTNTGDMEGEEVVQLYITDVQSSFPVPIRSLQGFQRIFLRPGETKTVEFVLSPRQVSLIDDKGRRVIEPGLFAVAIGGKQPGQEGIADSKSTQVITGQFKITGEFRVLAE